MPGRRCGGVVRRRRGGFQEPGPQTELAAHWGLARAGYNLALAIVLAVSAIALVRRWPVAEVLVAMAAALLLRDAWFNVLTARPGHSAVALGVAAGLELLAWNTSTPSA